MFFLFPPPFIHCSVRVFFLITLLFHLLVVLHDCFPPFFNSVTFEEFNTCNSVLITTQVCITDKCHLSSVYFLNRLVVCAYDGLESLMRFCM